MLQEQEGKCAICKRAPDDHARNKALAVDHDHKTGQVRKLLCGQCNVGLGMFQHDPQLMQRAIEYLDGFRDEIDL